MPLKLTRCVVTWLRKRQAFKGTLPFPPPLKKWRKGEPSSVAHRTRPLVLIFWKSGGGVEKRHQQSGWKYCASTSRNSPPPTNPKYNSAILIISRTPKYHFYSCTPLPAFSNKSTLEPGIFILFKTFCMLPFHPIQGVKATNIKPFQILKWIKIFVE